MSENGLTWRDNKNEQQTMNYLQSEFNTARDWLGNTEEGIRSEGGPDAEKTIDGW